MYVGCAIVLNMNEPDQVLPPAARQIDSPKLAMRRGDIDFLIDLFGPPDQQVNLLPYDFMNRILDLLVRYEDLSGIRGGHTVIANARYDEPLEKMADIVADIPSARLMTAHIPHADVWNLYLWYTICHPRFDGNGRLARYFAAKCGLHIPTKEPTDEDILASVDPEGIYMPLEKRPHVDHQFAVEQRKVAFEWFRQHWEDAHISKYPVYQITSGDLKRFRELLEKYPFPGVEAKS
jgi:hypothetical protein